jgi:bifunctional non-homologous end joining protein LigD
VSEIWTVGDREVEITHPDRVLFPASGITKRHLADYYRRVAEVMLPHVEGRLVSMQRYPDGIGHEGFFHKDVPEYFPDWIRTEEVEKEGGSLRMLVIDEPATLVYLAQQSCITPHVWLSHADRRHHPDRLVLDFDPSTDDRGPVLQAARAARELLRELGLEPFALLTGSRGIHVTVPLAAREPFDDVRAFARDLAAALVARHPSLLTTETRKAKRGDKVFVDVLRNAYAQTAVPPYAVRAREGAPVATPVDWDELGPGWDPRKYTIRNLFRRLAQKRDPWQGIEEAGRGIGEARRALERR